MKFYSSIAEQYDFIFPFSPMQKKFIQNLVAEPLKEKHILDIGCGTGNLSIELSELFNSVTGIDLDKEMLNLAKEKSSKPKFDCLNMLELVQNFSPASFDSIVCFGNTLAHLDGEDQILDFLSQTKQLLKPEGKLLLQIINYDRILNQQVDFLPTIENEKIKFERFYSYNKEINKVNFDTRLTVKETGEILENNVQLYPILQNQLKELLVKAGYLTVNLYGNFKQDELTENSIPLVIEAY